MRVMFWGVVAYLVGAILFTGYVAADQLDAGHLGVGAGSALVMLAMVVCLIKLFNNE